MIKIKAIIILVSCLLPAYSYGQTTYLRQFTTKNGLPSNSCYYTLQDSKGYIWVATDAGVSRFDGRMFETFSIDDGLPDNQILQLKEDKKGKIWFLALNGRLSYYYNGKIYNEENDPLLKLLKVNAVIVSFYEDSKGRLWLGTNRNVLIMWDGKALERYVSGSPKHQYINTYIHEDQTGKIWAYSSQCVRLFDGATFQMVPYKTLPLSYKTVRNLGNRTMVYLDNKGVNLKSGIKNELLFPVDPAILLNNIGYFHINNNKDLWIGNSNGVYNIETNGKTTKYLDNISCNQVIQDREENLWFTTNSGIFMLPKKSERIYIHNKETGLLTNGIKSVRKDLAGRIWLGMDRATMNVIGRDHKVSVIRLGDEKIFNGIKQLELDAGKEAMYFSSEYGLGVVNDIYSDNYSIIHLRETENSLFAIKSFSIDNNNRLALALSSGVIVLDDRINNFQFSSRHFKHSKNFVNNRAYKVFYDSGQNLWFSNINGLYKKAGGTLTKYFDDNAALSSRINDIQELPDRTLVLATDGHGIVLVKDNKIIHHINQTNGLTNNICKKLYVKGNDVWVVTNNGINRISINGDHTIPDNFEYTSSLLTDDVNDIYVGSDTVYFATNNGLVYFHYTKSNAIDAQPKVHISSIINNKTAQSLGEKSYTFQPSDNNIIFTYSAIEFQNRNITYRYRLKSSANWTETRTRRVEFPSLEPGKYTFEVSAKTNNSRWSEPSTVSFELKGEFWQTYWFLTLIILLSALLLYKIAVFITKNQKDKEQEKLLLKNQILMLEQRALQAMMNPHFVFNVMNSIQHYINTKDTTSANKILTGFAKLIRKNLEICTKSFISLEEELEYLNLYLSLEKKRFGDKMHYSVSIDEKLDKEETFIPSMLLQPYIENAIWHGIMPKEEGGTVDIDIREVDEALHINITDDGIGIKNSLNQNKVKHVSHGMALTQERINLLNQIDANKIQIDIEQTGDFGTKVSITIPIN